MKYLILLLTLIFLSPSYSQDDSEKEEYTEYISLRVQYLERMSGPGYRIYLDIGTNGFHSLSGKVINEDDKVIFITDDDAKYECSSDMDVLNYLGKKGWKVFSFQEVTLLSSKTAYYYLLERAYQK